MSWYCYLAECAAGRYGVNCQDDCSSYCADPKNCDHQDGTCSPCDGWRIGRMCDLKLGEITVHLYIIAVLNIVSVD